MEIIYKNVQKIIEDKDIKYPEFAIFNQRGNVIKIAQWQPLGEITFDIKKGFSAKDTKHQKKAKAFIECVKNEKSDLVITPEYSFPWSVLEEILETQEMRPKYGKLWCLGMEGIETSELEHFLLKYQKKDDVFMKIEDLDNINQNEFYSCLVYLFVSSQKIICIIQLKTTAASDKWAELEAQGLTTGNEIYFFKDTDTNHCLFSIICADALNQEISKVKDQVNYQQCIILHPQLNPKPLHESFEQMRKGFLNYSRKNIRIITLNWGKGSWLNVENQKTIKIEDSYSACYYCDDTNYRGFSELYKKNKAKGIDVFQNEHILSWYMPEKEHCIFYTIDCFPSKELHTVTAAHKEPLGINYMEYDAECENWISKSACGICSIDWEWLKQTFHLEKCEDMNCYVDELSHFFAILFGRKKHSELELKDGKSQIIFQKTNGNSEEVDKQRERSSFIIEALEEENIPAKFSELKKSNYKWILHEKGNLRVKDSKDFQSSNICVVYVDSSTESAISKGIIEFQNLMGEESKDRMILYFLTSHGIKYYDKLYNIEVNNPELTHSVDEMK